MNEIIICGYTGRGFDSPHLHSLWESNMPKPEKIQRIIDQYIIMMIFGLGIGIIFTFIICAIAFAITYFYI